MEEEDVYHWFIILEYLTVLDGIITDIKRRHPNDGERLMIGHLASQNIRIPRTRLRASIPRVDPEGIAVGQRVWHIDGHHK